MATGYLQVFAPEQGNLYGDFYVYLPAGETFFAQYRFRYLKLAADPTLSFADRENKQANSDLYRIWEAYIGTLDGQTFTPDFRALQGGEVSFAFLEKGAGDFCGGIHGDECLSEAVLTMDGKDLALNRPYFGGFETLSFVQNSRIFRCNTPDQPLIEHRQRYTVREDALHLEQYIRWIADAMPLRSAYSPMLTAQRLDPMRPERVLTDTVEFYSEPGGQLLTQFDTAPYGAQSKTDMEVSVCQHTPAHAVRVWGQRSGFSAEAGYVVVDDSIPQAQSEAHLWIRFDEALDNKIYFDIGSEVAPKAGTVWKSRIGYRLRYTPHNI